MAGESISPLSDLSLLQTLDFGLQARSTPATAQLVREGSISQGDDERSQRTRIPKLVHTVEEVREYLLNNVVCHVARTDAPS